MTIAGQKLSAFGRAMQDSLDGQTVAGRFVCDRCGASMPIEAAITRYYDMPKVYMLAQPYCQCEGFPGFPMGERP